MGFVRGRSPTRWTLELGEGEEPAAWRTLATGGATGRRSRRMATVDPRGLAAGGYTLRLRATDANGNRGEDRAFFYSMRDPQLKRGYPRAARQLRRGLAPAGGPERRRAPEIVLATADGRVTVLSGRTGRRLRGWPKAMRCVRRAHRARGGSARCARASSARRRWATSPAGRGMEIVAAGLDGRVYAWTPRGRRVRGFPVRIDLRRPESDGRRDASIYASPALADLDGNGKLDIVVGAADQKIYAWNGRGRRLPGWPVLARDRPAATWPRSSPRPPSATSTATARPTWWRAPPRPTAAPRPRPAACTPSRRAASRCPAGRSSPRRCRRTAIPLAGEGVPASPSLADVDGDGRDEVAVSAFTGQPELFRGDGTRMSRTGEGNHFQSLRRGALVARDRARRALDRGQRRVRPHDPGGPLRLFGGLVDLAPGAGADLAGVARPVRAPAGRAGTPAPATGSPAFPRRIEGWAILSGPAVADVDGDGRAEVLAGSSGYRLHAVGEAGARAGGLAEADRRLAARRRRRSATWTATAGSRWWR